jgi:hypothetical protein
VTVAPTGRAREHLSGDPADATAVLRLFDDAIAWFVRIGNCGELSAVFVPKAMGYETPRLRGACAQSLYADRPIGVRGAQGVSKTSAHRRHLHVTTP